MILGEVNLIIVLFVVLITSIVLSSTSALHLILTAELVWITLYVLVLFLSYTYDNLNLLSLTFFFLILSAVEFGLGLVIILNQHLIYRSISLDVNNLESNKFFNKFIKKLKINTTRFN